MALQLRQGHMSGFGKTVAASFAVLALVAQPFYGVLSSQSVSAVVAPVTQNSSDWVNGDTRPGGTTSFSSDFGAPAGFGTSALKIVTTDGNAKAQKFHALPNIPLSDINDISYWTYRSATSTGNAVQVAAVNLVIDYNGSAPGGFTTLILEPVYQTNQTVLVNNTWQKWNGGNQDTWWSSNAIPSAPNRDTFVTLQTIKDSNPDATVSAFGFNQGSGNAGIISAVDGLTINGTTYNFEVALPATPGNLRLNGDKPCGYVTNVNQITPTWDAVPGAASYNYKVTLPNGSTHGPVNVGNETSVTGPFGAEGTSTFAVQTVSSDGLLSDWAASCAVTYDKTAPAVPTNGQPRDGAYKTTNDFYFTWNASAGAATYEFQSSGSNTVDGSGSLVGSWNSIANGNSEQNNLTTPQIHSTGAPDGRYYWQVRAIDAAGNKSAWSTVWDMRIDQKPAAPQLAVDGLTSGGSTNSYTITARWNKPAADVVKYLYEYWNDIPGNQYKESTPYSTELTSESSTGVFNQGEGTHFIRVYAIDSIGTRSEPSNTFQITYDSTSPVVTLGDIAAVNEGQNSTISGTVSDANTTTAVLYIDGLARASTAVSGGQYSFVVQLSQGPHDVYVVASDSAGNNTASETKVATVNQVIVNPEEPEEEAPIGTGNGNTGNPIIPDVTTPAATDTEDEADDSNEPDEIEQLQIFTQPIVVVNNPAVLGESDVSDGNQIAESGDTSDQSVMGTTDEKKNSTFSPLGFAWYWWLLVLAAIAGLWWLLAALRRRNAEDA